VANSYFKFSVRTFHFFLKVAPKITKDESDPLEEKFSTSDGKDDQSCRKKPEGENLAKEDLTSSTQGSPVQADVSDNQPVPSSIRKDEEQEESPAKTDQAKEDPATNSLSSPGRAAVARKRPIRSCNRKNLEKSFGKKGQATKSLGSTDKTDAAYQRPIRSCRRKTNESPAIQDSVASRNGSSVKKKMKKSARFSSPGKNKTILYFIWS
jgi:hypothetical protein